jgi:hypothetical protein
MGRAVAQKQERRRVCRGGEQVGQSVMTRAGGVYVVIHVLSAASAPASTDLRAEGSGLMYTIVLGRSAVGAGERRASHSHRNL